MIGQTIDRYRVVEKLGQGGMGVVYKARDSLLERFVALKVLPPEKSSDPERRQRFLQEAKSASALNHPGIVAVYDVVNHDGQDVLVMELVEGETLEQLLAQKRLTLGDALGLGIGVADALAKAHAAGIVHRDLKPSNVMVTPDGVKILDFGLAKLTESQFIDPEAPTVAPDESSLTHQRAILGTVGWMSPEQASGETVDTRSDIFAFGVLMYEMLTGKHPFRRKSTLETLAAIREEQPESMTSLVPSLPPEAERAVFRCMHKDPGRRWQSLSDLGAVLEDLKEDTESGRKIMIDHPGGRRRAHLPLVAGLAAVVLIAALSAVYLLRPDRDPSRPLKLDRLTYDAGFSGLPSISPDGNLVAFTSDRSGEGGTDIWVRHIKQPEPTRLTDHPAMDWSPRFSPDGSRLVFRSERDGGGIYVVNALGGGLRHVAGPGLFPRFSPDGRTIVFADDPRWAKTPLRRMYAVPANGGTAESFLPGWGVFRPPASIGPIFSPDGRMVLFHGAPLDDPRQRDWWVAPIDGGELWSSEVSDSVLHLEVVVYPVVWLQGRLLVAAGTTIEGVNLYSVGITDKGLISGVPTPLTTGPGITWCPSVAENGRIALTRYSWVIHLWEVALDPRTGGAVGPPRRITDDAAPKFSFSLTRAGDLLAYSTYAGPRGDRRAEIVLQDRTTNQNSVPVKLTQEQVSTSAYPHLSGDGTMLSWLTWSDGQRVSWFAPLADPVGRELCRGCEVVDFFNNGRDVLISRNRNLYRRKLADGDESQVFDPAGRYLTDVDLSPDERWLAVQMGEPDGTVAIFVVPLDRLDVEPESWVKITAGPRWSGAPRWSMDGNVLYFLSDRDDFICVWGQRLDSKSKVPIGEPFPVVHTHTSELHHLQMARFMWTLEVGGDRLVFNAGEMRGDVYTAMLDGN